MGDDFDDDELPSMPRSVRRAALRAREAREWAQSQAEKAIRDKIDRKQAEREHEAQRQHREPGEADERAWAEHMEACGARRLPLNGGPNRDD